MYFHEKYISWENINYLFLRTNIIIKICHYDTWNTDGFRHTHFTIYINIFLNLNNSCSFCWQYFFSDIKPCVFWEKLIHYNCIDGALHRYKYHYDILKAGESFLRSENWSTDDILHRNIIINIEVEMTLFKKKPLHQQIAHGNIIEIVFWMQISRFKRSFQT